MGADGAGAGEFLHPLEQQMVTRGQLGLPTVFDDYSLVRLNDDGRPFDFVAGAERGAQINVGALPLAAGKEARALRRRRQFAPLCLADFLLEPGAAADRLNRDRLDHQILVAVDKTELRFVGAFKSGLHFCE